MKKILEMAANSIWIKSIGFVLFSVLPAFNFYKALVMNLLGKVQGVEISFAKSFIDILTGFLLGGIFLLFLQSKNEYNRIRKENHRIREMLITVHILDNIRFSKLRSIVPTLFDNEETNLRLQLPAALNRDTGKDYSLDELKEILDCFYRDKPKFK